MDITCSPPAASFLNQAQPAKLAGTRQASVPEGVMGAPWGQERRTIGPVMRLMVQLGLMVPVSCSAGKEAAEDDEAWPALAAAAAEPRAAAAQVRRVGVKGDEALKAVTARWAGGLCNIFARRASIRGRA